MKKIVLFGAGKSATVLIQYLLQQAGAHRWILIVADGNIAVAESKIQGDPNGKAVGLNAMDAVNRQALIESSDLVISMLPPALHILVAEDCLQLKKQLLTASYIDDKLRQMQKEISAAGLLFLCEMGLDPGIDHMSAMELITRLKNKGAEITSFKSHTGGLIAPESDTNPWHYKISWNPRNVVLAGSAGAVYKENNMLKQVDYSSIFNSGGLVNAGEIGELAWYPNRDSLSYLPIYGLENTETFIRTTLRYPIFCRCWNLIVHAGLTDDQLSVEPQGLTFSKWSASLLPSVNSGNRHVFESLGLFDDLPVPGNIHTSADILQYLLETKLVMEPTDKDMIVMIHELGYVVDGFRLQKKSMLIVKGENSLQTAMAKTVGLPLGIAAKLLLTGKITTTGLQIPILPEIYLPVLEELHAQGIIFREEDH
jgi:saccharopine dehydrogenase-like NADP-dependent oxidoreductase